MAEKKGNSLLETKRKNRVFIKNLIYKQKNATRTAIADELGLTLATISTSINEMIRNEIIEEAPADDSFTGMGRRPMILRFKPDAAFSIGVDMGAYETRAVLTDLNGDVIKSVSNDLILTNYDHMLDVVEKMIREVMPSGEKLKKLVGIGVGIPGFVEPETGILRHGPFKSWLNKPFKKELEKRLNIPVEIDNNTRVRAYGYSMKHSPAGGGNFAYLFMSRGLSCPLMLDDRALSQNAVGSGELGYMITRTPEGVEKSMNELATERAVFEKCQEAVLSGRCRNLKKKIEKEGRLTNEIIMSCIEEGDPEVMEIVDEAMTYLGIAVANVVNFINPGNVVTDAYFLTNEHNRTVFKEAAWKRIFSLQEDELNFIFRDYDNMRGARAAAYFAIGQLYLNV